MNSASNTDEDVVAGFGAEWSRFSQEDLEPDELKAIFERYFGLFPWDSLPPEAEGADIGSGSGRWASQVAPRVGKLHCVDASSAALDVSRKNLEGQSNVEFHLASVGALPFTPESLDFAYSLGVLHHVPDTAAALKAVVRCLRRGAPLLVYLYYALDDRPRWFKLLWKGSDVMRAGVAKLPESVKNPVCDVIAAGIYWPIARLGMLLDRLHIMPRSWPLSAYRNLSFYVMRTDALDRFGTRLEHRFTRSEIETMMLSAGLGDVRFRDGSPYWCALGFKSAG